MDDDKVDMQWRFFIYVSGKILLKCDYLLVDMGYLGVAWQRGWFIASMVNLVVDIFIYQGMRSCSIFFIRSNRLSSADFATTLRCSEHLRGSVLLHSRHDLQHLKYSENDN